MSNVYNTYYMYIILRGSREYPYPHHRGSLEIPRRRAVLKAKTVKGKYEPKLEFPVGWGVQNKKKTLHVGRMDIFWSNTFSIIIYWSLLVP